MAEVLHRVAATHSYSPINDTLPAHHGHNVRVTFLAQPLLCTIFIVPRTTIYEIRGDFREPETNPDYYLIGFSRSERLESFAESLTLRKVFDAWSSCGSRILLPHDEAAAVLDRQGEEEREAASLSWPVRLGFRFSAVPHCLPRDDVEEPDAVDASQVLLSCV